MMRIKALLINVVLPRAVYREHRYTMEQARRERWAWDDALSDPATRPALDQGLREVTEGKTKPWHEIR
jgi:hypothetical protein